MLLKGREYNKELEDRAWLIPLPHHYVSICVPDALHVLFGARDEWFSARKLKYDARSTSESVRLALDLLPGHAVDWSVTEIFRFLFKKLLATEMESLFPDLKLSMIQKVHAHGMYDSSSEFSQRAPDQHLLVCSQAARSRGQGFGRVELGSEELRAATLRVFVTLAETSEWIAKRWSGQNRRHGPFVRWRKALQAGVQELQDAGLPDDCVDVRSVRGNDTLNVLTYMCRKPMSGVKSVRVDPKRDSVLLRFRDRDKPARLGVFDFLLRLAGEDERQAGLRPDYHGVYARKRGRSRKVAVHDFMESYRVHLIGKMRLAMRAPKSRRAGVSARQLPSETRLPGAALCGQDSPQTGRMPHGSPQASGPLTGHPGPSVGHPSPTIPFR